MIEKISKEEASAKAESINLPAGPLSYTQIETFSKCQRLYYLKYIARLPQKYSVVMNMGSALHTGLEVLHNGLISDSSERTAGTIARHLETALLALRSQVGLIMKNPAVVPAGVGVIEKQGKCLEELLKLWSREYVPEMDIVEAESKFYVLIKEVPTNIRIDLMRKNRVSDFKVSKKDKSDKDVKNSLQLGIYAIGAELNEVSFITLKYPVPEKLHKWEPVISEVSGEKTQSDKDWAIEIVGAIAKTLGTKADRLPEYFPPCNPSDWACSPEYCDLYDHCRGATKKAIVMPSWLNKVRAK